jgi:hypothetical protein
VDGRPEDTNRCSEFLQAFAVILPQNKPRPFPSQFITQLIIIFGTVRAIDGVFKETLNHTERQIFPGV